MVFLEGSGGSTAQANFDINGISLAMITVVYILLLFSYICTFYCKPTSPIACYVICIHKLQAYFTLYKYSVHICFLCMYECRGYCYVIYWLLLGLCYITAVVEMEFVVDCDHTFDMMTGILTITCETTTPGQQITGLQYSVDGGAFIPGKLINVCE